jgi:Protein of unknown function (DUF3040)
VPVGAGGDALRRIEASLAADDPDLVESFRRWRAPSRVDPTDDGTMWVGGWTMLVVATGGAAIAAGVVGVVAVLLSWFLLRVAVR